MSVYNPDGWVLVKIGGTDPHYRVFGSWRGGYLDGDSWRLNSGITKMTREGSMIEFHGHTGSVYQVHESSYGRLGIHNEGVVRNYEERANGTFVVLNEMPDLDSLEW